MKATFYWYMTQVLKIEDYDAAFERIDDHTVRINIPNSSPLLDRLWVNNDLGHLRCGRDQAAHHRRRPLGHQVARLEHRLVLALPRDEVLTGPGGDLRGERELLPRCSGHQEGHLPGDADVGQPGGGAAERCGGRRRVAAAARAGAARECSGGQDLQGLRQLHPPGRDVEHHGALHGHAGPPGVELPRAARCDSREDLLQHRSGDEESDLGDLPGLHRRALRL